LGTKVATKFSFVKKFKANLIWGIFAVLHPRIFCLSVCYRNITLMMEAVRTSETSVDNYFTRQYIPEDNSEHHKSLYEAFTGAQGGGG
jgi:hypothetical protein